MTNTFQTAASDFMKLIAIQEDRKLDFIDYAATDFASLRSAFIDYLKAVYPLDYQNYAESDFGIMFADLVAYMGSVMSLKADYLANEIFITTAKNRANVKKALDLVGVKLKGPISAAANGKITSPTATAAGETIIISPENRVIVISSPEDNAPLNYTIYKVSNGILVDVTSDSSITLNHSESTNEGGTEWTNIALIEGAYVLDTGTFTSTNEALKKVTLSEGPVIENSIEVFINSPVADSSGTYTQVENLFFASGTDDKIFEVRYDRDYNATVLFGDGNTGISPPNNSSYRITYRVGGGTRGNLQSSFINALSPATHSSAGSVNLTVENTNAATGGADVETLAHAKRYGPLFFKTQDRLVSLEDYVAFVNRFVSTVGATGIATAATRKAFCSANIVDIFLLEKASTTQLSKASVAFKQELLEVMKNKKMLTDEIVIVDGLIRAIDLIVTINIDRTLQKEEGSIKGKVAAKILEYFTIDNRSFGESLKLADLSRVIFEIPEVRFSSIDNLDENILVEFNEIIQLNNLTINVNLI